MNSTCDSIWGENSAKLRIFLVLSLCGDSCDAFTLTFSTTFDANICGENKNQWQYMIRNENNLTVPLINLIEYIVLNGPY